MNKTNLTLENRPRFILNSDGTGFCIIHLGFAEVQKLNPLNKKLVDLEITLDFKVLDEKEREGQ